MEFTEPHGCSDYRTFLFGEGKYPYPCKKCPFNKDVYFTIK